MKKILFVIAAFLCMTLSLTSRNVESNFNKCNKDEILRNVLPDSVYSLLKGKSVIFYSYGHYGYSWSLIAKMDSGYQTLSGKVDYVGEQYFNKPSESNQFDTTHLFSKNHALFSWGFDTIASKVKSMKKISRDPYVTIYTNLSIINSDGVNVFNSDDAVAYSGPDSLCFNRKYHKLCLIMRWLSDTNIRQYIPDSVIY